MKFQNNMVPDFAFSSPEAYVTLEDIMQWSCVLGYPKSIRKTWTLRDKIKEMLSMQVKGLIPGR